MAYWKSLAQRRANSLIQEDSDTTIPYCVATGMVDKLTAFFSHRGQLQDAMLTALAGYEGSIVEPAAGGKVRRGAGEQNGLQNGDDDEHLQ